VLDVMAGYTADIWRVTNLSDISRLNLNRTTKCWGLQWKSIGLTMMPPCWPILRVLRNFGDLNFCLVALMVRGLWKLSFMHYSSLQGYN
jgi:hypothetical protein